MLLRTYETFRHLFVSLSGAFQLFTQVCKRGQSAVFEHSKMTLRVARPGERPWVPWLGLGSTTGLTAPKFRFPSE